MYKCNGFQSIVALAPSSKSQIGTTESYRFNIHIHLMVMLNTHKYTWLWTVCIACNLLASVYFSSLLLRLLATCKWICAFIPSDKIPFQTQFRSGFHLNLLLNHNSTDFSSKPLHLTAFLCDKCFFPSFHQYFHFTSVILRFFQFQSQLKLLL